MKQSIPVNQIPIMIVDKKRKQDKYQVKSLRQRKILKGKSRDNSTD